jgi:hypothetical protein
LKNGNFAAVFADFSRARAAAFADNKTMETPEITDDTPPNSQTAKTEAAFNWYITYLPDGKHGERIAKGSIPVADCPTQEDVQTALDESSRYPFGLFKIDKKKTGQFNTKETWHYMKSPPALFQRSAQQPTIEIVPENDDQPDFDEPDFDINSEIEARAELIALRREIQEIRRTERERIENANNSQNETLSMMREMQAQSEKSFQQGLEMAKMIMQSAKPPQDPTQMMLQMLQGTLAVQKGVRELSEQVAPDKESGGGSLIADGAKLIDSLGRNAGTFLPLIFGGGIGKAPAAPRTAKPQNAPATNGDGQNGGIADLANKVKAKEATKK